MQQNKNVNSEQNDSSAANWLTKGSESEGHWEWMIRIMLLLLKKCTLPSSVE